jgi:hypothetical protein
MLNFYEEAKKGILLRFSDLNLSMIINKHILFFASTATFNEQFDVLNDPDEVIIHINIMEVPTYKVLINSQKEKIKPAGLICRFYYWVQGFILLNKGTRY